MTLERRKCYSTMIILVTLAIIAFFGHRFIMKETETYHINQTKAFVESYGWKTEFLTTVDTSISEKAHSDFAVFRNRSVASQDIGLDYMVFKDKKVKLYVLNTGKRYQNKSIYAYVLQCEGQIIGAYLQSQSDIISEAYVFSLKDQELKNPYME